MKELRTLGLGVIIFVSFSLSLFCMCRALDAFHFTESVRSYSDNPGPGATRHHLVVRAVEPPNLLSSPLWRMLLEGPLRLEPEYEKHHPWNLAIYTRYGFLSGSIWAVGFVIGLAIAWALVCKLLSRRQIDYEIDIGLASELGKWARDNCSHPHSLKDDGRCRADWEVG